MSYRLSNHPNDKNEALPTVDAISPAVGRPAAAALDNGYFSATNIAELEARGIEPYITDPAHPVLIFQYERPPYGIYSVMVVGDIAYVGTESGLAIVDVSDPAAPRELSFPCSQSESGTSTWSAVMRMSSDQVCSTSWISPIPRTHARSGVIRCRDGPPALWLQCPTPARAVSTPF